MILQARVDLVEILMTFSGCSSVVVEAAEVVEPIPMAQAWEEVAENNSSIMEVVEELVVEHQEALTFNIKINLI
jgi:hypothetical protein